MGVIRCFVAAELPEAVQRELGELQGRLRAGRMDLRWVSPSRMHLTLKFLGEVSEKTFDAVCGVLEDPLGVPSPIRVSLRGVGAFPSLHRARVLWVGLAGDLALLARAALTVEAKVEELGIPREARPFSPHLTIGRSRMPSGLPGLEGLLQAEADYAGPDLEIDRLVLYESRLRPEGPLYLARKTIVL